MENPGKRETKMRDPEEVDWSEPLSQREVEILRLISDGLTNREIAQKLVLSVDTVKWYNKQLYSKLGVSSRTQAASLARQKSILDPSATSKYRCQPDKPGAHGRCPA